jgi:nitrite reductase/ring-hydroxylating ferredoxin subunit
VRLRWSGLTGNLPWRKGLQRRDRRVRQMTTPGRASDDYPAGWYFVAFGKDVPRDCVVPVELMGNEYALFRTGSGAVGLIGSRCCHMGANLARCGLVDGERLACGYHGWEFNTDGRCERVPELDRVPATAVQTAPSVLEKAGNIWFWHGSEPVGELEELDFVDSGRFITLAGEAHLGRSDPLPIIEHIADISHFPHNHKSTGPLEYVILTNEGDRFEFQLRPKRQGDRNIQRMFRPFALVTMVSPCTGVYRTQQSLTPDRDHPLLTMILGVTPVRPGVTVFSWRVVVRKIGPDWIFYPLNRALAGVMWLIIRRNVHVDLEVLKWMQPPDRTLWVAPDGQSVREFRKFYERNRATADADRSTAHASVDIRANVTDQRNKSADVSS